MTRERFVNEYIKLASYEINYGFDISIEKHNKNFKELESLYIEIKNDIEDLIH